MDGETEGLPDGDPLGLRDAEGLRLGDAEGERDALAERKISPPIPNDWLVKVQAALALRVVMSPSL